MLISEMLQEKYDEDHECKTPGAVYTTEIHNKTVTIKVKLPKGVSLNNLDKEKSLDLESDLHYAIEEVLAPFFKS